MRKLICFGDSLTAGDDLEPYAVWPALVGNRLRLTVINRGIGGDTTGGMLARFPTQVVVEKPDAVLIFGGTNDLWWGLDANIILANLFAMVCQARHAGIAPLLITPLPILLPAVRQSGTTPPAGGFERCQEELKRLADLLCQEAENSEVGCLDAHGLFLDVEGSADGECYLEDGLHLNRRGHHRLAASVARSLNEYYGISQ